MKEIDSGFSKIQLEISEQPSSNHWLQGKNLYAVAVITIHAALKAGR